MGGGRIINNAMGETMVSKEWSTIVKSKLIDEDTIKLSVENCDSKSTVLISISDAKEIAKEILDLLANVEACYE